MKADLKEFSWGDAASKMPVRDGGCEVQEPTETPRKDSDKCRTGKILRHPHTKGQTHGAAAIGHGLQNSGDEIKSG